jgi:serine/threonine-protein kinase
VIPIYDADEIDGVLYLAMRYVNGPSLQTLLRERRRLSPEETLRIAEQIGGGLDAAHRAGLVHRDVKPANILIAEPGDHAYLCDFGLAKRTSSKAVTQTGAFLGTVDYCAPEQIQGRPLDGRADIYSLGGVLFHCLAGQPPYKRDTEFAVLQAHLADPPPALSSLRPDLPASLDDVLDQAMAKDPDERFSTAGELVTAFGDALAGRLAPANGDATRAAPRVHTKPAQTLVARRGRRLRGRRGPILAAVILAAVLGGTVAVLLATRGSEGGASAGGPATPKLRTFVDRIENVLEQSAEGRREISTSLTAGFKCSISAREAGQRIASVADNRQSILGQLGSLQTPTQQADEVVTHLQRALQQSIEADRHYRDGFVTAAESPTACPLPSNPSFRLAADSDAQATAAKRRFVAAFDPLAKLVGRRTWSASEI